MSDREDSFICRQITQRLLNNLFRLIIQRRRSLIKKQYLTILQKGPGNGQALLLPPTQTGPTLPHHRLHSLG